MAQGHPGRQHPGADMKLRRRALLGSAAVLALSPRITRAQTYPDRPIRFIVPYAPGGSTDTSARIAAEKLTQLLGQTVVVENKAGGGTIIGTESVVRARPDGYTLLLSPAALIANAAFGVKVPYDIDKDLAPIVVSWVFAGTHACFLSTVSPCNALQPRT